MGLDLTPGQLVQLPKEYKLLKARRDFWRLSFRCNTDYKGGADPDGQPILIQHESETPEAYVRRRLVTTPRQYVSPILRRYNDFVFRREPSIPGYDQPWFESWLADCDGFGNDALQWFRRRLLAAQVDRESYILLDRTGESEAPSRLEQQRGDIRPIVRWIDPDAVIYCKEYSGSVSQIAYMAEDAEGDLIKVMDGQNRWAWRVQWQDDERSYKVIGIAQEPTAHGYAQAPVVILRPLFDDFGMGANESQAAPFADSQRSVYNLLALEKEELYSNTYTQWFVSGVSKEHVSDGKVEFGAKRLFVTPNTGASLNRIGSDVAQAQSIREAIRQEETSIQRMAGIGDATQGNPESGIAKAFRFNDLAANLSALADAVEDAWNRTVALMADAWGYEYPGDASWPDDFDPPDMGAELANMLDAIGRPGVPPTIKQHLVQRFADRNLALSEDEADQLSLELITMGQSPLSPSPGMLDSNQGAAS